MTKQLLAEQLRIRLAKEATKLSLPKLKSISDDLIIESYNRCSCCGDKFLTDLQLTEAIERSDSAEDFLSISCQMEHESKVITQN